MKDRFNISAYLALAEANYSNFDDGGYETYEEYEPKFDRRRILLICR